VVARWFQYGMFCPIFRVHRADNDSAPWFYGDEVEKIIADTIRFRYRLMPYIYSLTKLTREQGYNPMRPLFMDFAQDPKTVDITTQFMYGPAFLVCPVTRALYHPYDPKGATQVEIKGKERPVKSIEVYLPKGSDWYDFRTGKKHAGGQSIQSPAPLDWMPLFVRAGSIVPMGKVIQNTTSEKQTEIELRIYPGADAEFTLYDDDGVSYQYEAGAHAQIPLSWDDGKKTLTIGARQGSFKGMSEKLVFKMVVVDEHNGIGSLAEYDGEGRVEYTGEKICTVMK
jgi:alpha-D-xyloside xylohydrolase